MSRTSTFLKLGSIDCGKFLLFVNQTFNSSAPLNFPLLYQSQLMNKTNSCFSFIYSGKLNQRELKVEYLFYYKIYLLYKIIKNFFLSFKNLGLFSIGI